MRQCAFVDIRCDEAAGCHSSNNIEQCRGEFMNGFTSRMVRAWNGVLFLTGASMALLSTPAAANVAVRADPASGTNASQIYWMDWTGLAAPLTTGPGSQPYSFTLVDGSTLTLTLTRGGPSTAPFAGTTVPTFGGAAIGNAGYTGFGAANVALYPVAPANIGSNVSFQLSNIVLTNPAGNPVSKFEIVLADSESMDTGDGGVGANITFTTTGGNWEVVERVPAVGRAAVALTGIGTQTLVQPAGAAPVPAWIVGTAKPVTGAFNVTATLNSTARQGIMLGIRVGSITLNKNIASRSNAADQFLYRIKNALGTSVGSGAAPCAAAGDCTTAGAGVGNQTPISAAVSVGNVITLEEAMAPGSVGTLASYNKTISCSNTNTTSLTVLPPAGAFNPASPPQITILSGSDNISCTISNAGTGADMRATGAVTQTTAVGVPVTFVTSCTNDGPEAATAATCTVAQNSGPAIPGLVTTCTPPPPVGSLAVGATISCSSTFTPATAGIRTFLTTAGSATADLTPANNIAPATSINVGGVTATPDASSTPLNTPVTTNVIANDVSASGFPLNPASVTLQTGPTNGAVVCNASGSCTYTPNTNFEGVDTYTYQVCDTSPVPICSTTTVTITVSPTAAAVGGVTGVPMNSREMLVAMALLLLAVVGWKQFRAVRGT
jgi:hypothetical protein